MENPEVVITSEAAAKAVAEATTVMPPFRQLESDDPARIVLEQVNGNQFKLLEGFRYDGRAGTWTVLPEDLPTTDLASIPRAMGWFAGSYGVHTLAALLHDHLVRNGGRLDPPVPRYQADEVFRDALDDLGVNQLRSRIMWAAVAFATRWRSSWPAAAAMSLWVIGAVLGIAMVVTALIVGDLSLLIAAIVAPAPFSILWGRRELWVGLVGGYTLWFIALPTLFGALAYALYQLAELVFRLLYRIAGRN